MIIDELKDQYNNETENMFRAHLSYMKDGTDNISKSTLDYVYTCLENYLLGTDCCPRDFYYTKRDEKRFEDEIEAGLYDKYIIDKKCQEVFYTHHGLRFAKQPILDYIKDKDIIDAGAFIGDSALILSPYTTKKIYSYEVNEYNYEQIINTSQLNHIEDKVVPLLLGLSDENGIMYSSDDNVSIGNILTTTGENAVNVTTIDDEVEKRKIIPGFIKADTEGFEYRLLMGGLKTIQKYRPILSISIYHNVEGLFGVTEFIKRLGNYHIQYRAPSQTPDFSELIVFAYPAEIPLYEDPFIGDE